MTASTDIALELAAIAEDLALAMRTYEQSPLGGKVREGLVTAAEALAQRISSLILRLEYEDEGDRIAQDEEEHRYDDD